MKKIAVLSDSSLLTQGMISRLREYSCSLELFIIDLARPNPLGQIMDYQPDIILFDEGDIRNMPRSFLTDILDSVPQATVIELHLNSPNVHLIQSVPMNAANADELIQIFNSFASNPGNALGKS